MGEAPAQAAVREVKEETGLVLGAIEFVAVTNNVFSSENHSISLCFEAECSEPEQLELTEPEKCLGWQWHRWQEVEEKLFLPLANLKKSNYQPFIRD
jgi:8-oxo-dGTP diphosphatase